MIYTFNTFRLWPRWLHIWRVTGNVIKKTTKESRELSHSSRAPPPHRRPARTNCGHHCSAREGLKFQTELPRWHRTSDTPTIQKITIWAKFEANSKPLFKYYIIWRLFWELWVQAAGPGRQARWGRQESRNLSPWPVETSTAAASCYSQHFSLTSPSTQPRRSLGCNKTLVFYSNHGGRGDQHW